VTATIYLVRHGRTALNAQRRFRGRENPPLDAEGIVQAATAARQLTSSGIRAVFTSPLLRGVQTAEVIARAIGIAPLSDGRLIDLDHGVWTALTAEEAAEAEPEAFSLFLREPQHAQVPGGESMQAVERRMLGALTRMAESLHGGAAAVSHEIPIRLVIARLAGIEGPAFWQFELPTGSVTRLDYEEGTFSLSSGVRMGGVP
jgi:broad specificity phosphatase PhoE